MRARVGEGRGESLRKVHSLTRDQVANCSSKNTKNWKTWTIQTKHREAKRLRDHGGKRSVFVLHATCPVDTRGHERVADSNINQWSRVTRDVWEVFDTATNSTPSHRPPDVPSALNVSGRGVVLLLWVSGLHPIHNRYTGWWVGQLTLVRA